LHHLFDSPEQPQHLSTRPNLNSLFAGADQRSVSRVQSSISARSTLALFVLATMALHQTVDAETLAWYYERAKRQYPDDNPETALNKLIIKEKRPEVFFLNESGERCVWGAGKFFSVLSFYTGSTRSALTDLKTLHTSTIGAQDPVTTNTKLGTDCSLFADTRRL
jgi:hypothetical protein